MKTTLDLPPELVREMKMRAAREGRKLRDVATEIFRRGLGQTPATSVTTPRRVHLPLVPCHASPNEMSADQLADVLLKQEIEWTHETAGR